MIYVAIDTCIFMRTWSQGRSGCEIEYLRELKRLAERKAICLVLPEVVELEIEKNWREFPTALGNAFGIARERLQQALQKPNKVWNEIEDVNDALAKFLETWKSEKRKTCEERYKEIDALLSSKAIQRISLTSDILLNVKRRLIRGKMPEARPRADQDALIVESLVTFFNAHEGKDRKLYFCSDNHADFALKLDNGNGFILHPLLGADLPTSFFFTDLASLVKAVKEHKPPPKPTAADVKEALNRDEEKRQKMAREMATILDTITPFDSLAGVGAAIGSQSAGLQALQEAIASHSAAFQSMREFQAAIGPQSAGLRALQEAMASHSAAFQSMRELQAAIGPQSAGLRALQEAIASHSAAFQSIREFQAAIGSKTASLRVLQETMAPHTAAFQSMRELQATIGSRLAGVDAIPRTTAIASPPEEAVPTSPQVCQESSRKENSARLDEGTGVRQDDTPPKAN